MKNYKFDPAVAAAETIKYIKNWFTKYGTESSKAVIGISGGKDSTIVAKLCVEALGADRVFGVLLPNSFQSDLNIAKDVAKYLGIEHVVINIGACTNALHDAIFGQLHQMSLQATTNLPPRIRMTALYAVAQNMNGFVINTSNLSEDWIGWATIGGDTMGAFGPISLFTCTEVIQIGSYLGLPDKFIMKSPSDGLTGKTDEDAFGFTYRDLDIYIRTGECDPEMKKRVDYKHSVNLFKLHAMDIFVPDETMFYETVDGDDNTQSLPCMSDDRTDWKLKQKLAAYASR